MKLRDLRKFGCELLAPLSTLEEPSAVPSETILLEVDILIVEAAAPGANNSWIYAHLDDKLSEVQVQRAKQNFKRRAQSEPIAYIIGKKEFYGRDFFVSQGVLIPRPETEILMEQALTTIDSFLTLPSLIFEIGTGSGCLIASLALERPIDGLSFSASDISAAALTVARKNLVNYSLDNKIKLQKADCYGSNSFTKDNYCSCLVVSNPPYIPDQELLPRDVEQYEPAQALRAGRQGLDIIEKILLGIRDFSAGKRTVLLLEIGYSQRQEIEQLLASSGFNKFKFFKDLREIDRVLKIEVD